MYDPSKSVPLEPQSMYAVLGENLIQLNNLLSDVFSRLKWLQTNMSDNLSFLASSSDDHFARFVARVGMQLQEMNQILVKCNSYKLDHPCYHLELAKVEPQQSDSKEG
jgi:hypothetical protein